MGFVGLKVTESRQVAGPTMFSFEEEEKSKRTKKEELEIPSKNLFDLNKPKPEKSNIEKLMRI